MSHAFAQEMSEEAEARAKTNNPHAPATGLRSGLSESYFDKLAEDAARERAKKPE